MRDAGQNEQVSKPLTFQAILAPMSVDQFRAESVGRSPLHLTGAPGRFRQLLDWEALARLLENHPLEPPRLHIVKAGKPIPKERYLRHLGEMVRIDGGALSLLLDDGATAIINVVDDLVPAIAALADEVGESLIGRPAVNLYATWRSDSGFNAHSDFHDVIVLQLAGRKQWTIYKPTRTNPLRGDAFEPVPAGTDPDLVEVLEDGDLLYLPRGWVHAPVPLDEPSLHLTISVTHPTGAGFLDWLADELKEVPEVRAAIPEGADARAEWKARLSAIASNAIEGNAVDRYLAYKDNRRTARPHFSFPDFGRIPPAEWTDATILRPASQHRFVVETNADGLGRITAMGQSLPCSGAVATALTRLTSTHPLTLGALAAELGEADAAQLRQLLALLATFGLLAAERG